MTKYPVIILCLLIFCISKSSAQININFQNPSDFSACSTTRFAVTIGNDFNETLEDISVSVQLPVNCGVTYQANTIENATELNISDLGHPVFSLDDLPAGEEVTVFMELAASCAVVNCINTGQTFNHLISVSANLGSNSITTSPYSIETPLLVITDISEVLMSGSKGDILERQITIQNTREGELSTFTFTDTHQGGLDISFNVGNPVNMGNNTAAITLTGTDFEQIGNGDMLFELDETITIVEQILITSCGLPQTSSASEIQAYWSCNEEICQASMLTALVEFETSQLRPDLVFEPLPRSPLCFCGGTGDTQGMTIINNGTEAASDIILTIRQQISDVLYGPTSGIDPNSFVIDSSGVITSVVPQTLNPFAPLDVVCELPDNLFETAFVRIPSLSIGETVSVFWDLYHCAPECNQPFVEWEYDYGYYKPCPPNPFVGAQQLYASTSTPFLNTSLESPTDTLKDGETYIFSYQVEYADLNQIAEILTVDIFIPCGLIWEDNDLILNGESPISVTEIELTTGVQIIAEYDLPFVETTATMDFELQFVCADLCNAGACQDSLITSCLIECPPPPPPDLVPVIITSINNCHPFPLSCGIQSCIASSFLYECNGPSACPVIVEGYLSHNFEIYRTNLGLPDNNNDRIADTNGDLNLDFIRQDRAMTADTLEAKLEGEIIIDVPGTSFKYGLVDLFFEPPIDLSEENLEGLFSSEGFVPLQTTLRIIDASTNTTYECEDVIPLPSQNLHYSYDLSPAALVASSCIIPMDFEYEQGDSIILIARYVINYNMKKNNPTDLFPPIATVSVYPSPYFYNTPILDRENTFICGCMPERLQVTSYEYTTFPGVYPLPPCDTSDFMGAMLFKLDIGDGNFFPFEHRYLATVSDFEIAIPDFIRMTEAKITRFAMQVSLENNQEYFIKQDEPIPINFEDGKYHFDFSTCQNPSLDEGFNFLLQYRFLTDDCEAANNYPIHVFSTLDFVPRLPEATNPLMDTLTSNALRPLRPNLFLEAPIENITSLDNQARWSFDFFNFPNNVTSTASGTAENVWLYPTSNSGGIDNFQLYNVQTGEIIPNTNGIFQLGNLAANDTITYELIADNHSCILETVTIRYGWNCEPYTNPNFSPCYEKTALLQVTSPPGEIELIVQSPSTSHDLCDTVPYHTIEIFNAQLGNVFDVFLEGQLPPGLDIVSGSTQIAYPSGTDFINVADPDFSGDNLYSWNIANLNDSIALNGLASVSLAPAHSITLRFQTMTSCDFIAGAYIEFLARANQNCAVPTNYLSEVGQPINISDVEQPYEAFISGSMTEVSGCQDSTRLMVQMNMTEATDLRDSVFISLPAGLTYVPNSYTPISNAPTSEPLVEMGTNSQNLKWILPADIPANTPIAFEVTVVGFENLDCGLAPILIRTVAESQALCVVNGEDCSILVETGSSTIDAVINRPYYNLSHFNIQATPTNNGHSIDFSLQIHNLFPGTTTDSTQIDFYLDQDGDGLFSNGDIFVVTSVFSEPLLANGTAVFTGTFELINGDFCNLIAVIDPLENCACQTDETSVDGLIIIHLPDIEQVCSGQDTPIGVPEMTGHTYEWSPSDNLSCTDCAMPIFNIENNSDDLDIIEYTLTADDNAGCVTQYQVQVEVLPVLGILTENSTICEGQFINLVASSEALQVFWQPGNFNEQIYTVSPSETTTYQVTMVDIGGCINTDEVTVTVASIPEVDAGDDQVFCGLTTPMLNASLHSEHQYQWSPAAVLSNSAIPNPLILTDENTLFSLTITDENGCQNMDEVQINFGEIPNISTSEDAMICLGTSTQLEATGGNNYQWSPAMGLSCTNCPTPTATPDETTLYTVTASDGLGCTASASVLVTVTDGEILTFEERSTCINEPIDIFGMLTTEAGFYFDTMAVDGGCLAIHRIELLVADTIFEEVLVPPFCEGDTLVLDEQIFTEAGEFCFTFPSEMGCDSTVCYIVEILELPNVNFPTDVDIFLGESVDVEVIINSDSANYTFVWTPEIGLSCTDCPNPTATPTETTTYTLVVTDENGCEISSSITITVNFVCEVSQIEIPNLFTPNDDDANDVFEVVRPKGGTETVLDMRVYNRWGQLVFQGSGDAAVWDGQFEGERCPSDVYVYYILISCPSEELELTGDVTLIR